jgi:hypothetical protein
LAHAISSLAYPNLLGTKRLVVVVVVAWTQAAAFLVDLMLCGLPFLGTVTDLQCQIRVDNERENFNINYYNVYYSTTTVLK